MKLKKILFGALCLFILSTNVQSQNVPDTALANAISNACPTCIDMNTQNLTPFANTINTLNLVINNNTHSFEGLQLLTGLSKFKILVDFWNLSNNNIDSLGNLIVPALIFPPNLTHLTVYDNNAPSSSAFMTGIALNLPTTITHLELAGFAPANLNLPPNLEYLKLSYMYCCIATFPSTMKEMILTEFVNCSANSLEIPSSLERLSLFETSGIPSISVSNINIFGINSNLRYLKYYINDFSTEYYHIDYNSFPNLDTLIAYKLHPTFIDGIPANVKYLKIEGVETFNLNLINNQLTALKNLILVDSGDPDFMPVLPNNINSLTYWRGGSTGIPFIFNSPLPDSLKYCAITCNPSNICLPTLPQGLLKLESSFKNDFGADFSACIPNNPPQLQVYYNSLLISPPLCDNSAPNCYTFQVPTVTGNCFLDLNSNTINDGEPLLNHPIRREEMSSGTLSYIYPNNNFMESFYDFPDTSDSYTYDVVNAYSNYNAPVPTTINTTNLNAQHYTLSLPFTPAQSFDDIEVLYGNTYNFYPGLETNIAVSVRNIGTNNATGNVAVIIDPALTVTNPNGGTVNGDTINFSFSNLVTGQTQNFNFQAIVSTSAQFGDSLHLNFNADITGNDIDTTNNFFIVDEPVLASFDPNAIIVNKIILSGAEVQQDAYLTYTIQFQNTGNATALNIYLTDSLSAYLDPAYFETIFSSHPNYQLQFINTTDPLKPYLLKVIYNNINLPDSNSNEINSHGTFAFRIKVKNNTGLGSIIPATAAIYFDYNPAVITNLVTTLIMDPTKTNFNSQMNFISHIAPNPANESVKLMINSESNCLINLSFFNTSGQIIHTQEKQIMKGQNLFEQSLVNLSPGFYFIKISDANGKNLGMHKLIKQ